MKTKYLLLPGIIATFMGCSSAYRVGQTPDDVYYSPAPPQVEYVTSNNQQDRDSYGYNNASSNIEDLAVRRGINDPMYRSGLSMDFGYGYDPYNYFGSSFYSPYSSFYSPYSYPLVTFYPYNYNYYNSFYSPFYNYYYPPVYYISKSGGASANYSIGPRRYNLNAFNSGNTPRNYTPVGNANTNSVPVRTFNTPPANTTGNGSFIRRIFTPANNNRNSTTNTRTDNNNSYTPPVRTFQPSTTSGNSGSSSSGSSGSAPVRTFRK